MVFNECQAALIYSGGMLIGVLVGFFVRPREPGSIDPEREIAAQRECVEVSAHIARLYRAQEKGQA